MSLKSSAQSVNQKHLLTEDLTIIQNPFLDYFLISFRSGFSYFRRVGCSVQLFVKFYNTVCTKIGQGRITENYLTRLRFMESLIKGYLLLTEKGNYIKKEKKKKNLNCDVRPRVTELTLEQYCTNIQFSPIEFSAGLYTLSAYNVNASFIYIQSLP